MLASVANCLMGLLILYLIQLIFAIDRLSSQPPAKGKGNQLIATIQFKFNAFNFNLDTNTSSSDMDKKSWHCVICTSTYIYSLIA